MTGQETLDYIVRTLKRDDKNTEIFDSLTDVIMEIGLLFKSEENAYEAFSTFISAVGDYKLPLPQDFGHIIGDITAVDQTTKETWPVRKITKEMYDERYGDRLLDDTDDIKKDKPKHFCIFGEQLFLGAVPDKASYLYQINYTIEEGAIITAATASVRFTDRYRRTIKYGVLADIYMGLGLDEEAAKWQALYDRDITRISANDEDNTQEGDNDPVQYHGV